jgi:hypothetical protein
MAGPEGSAMAKRQHVTKLLAVMVMTASPALASPEPPQAQAPAARASAGGAREPVEAPARPQPAAPAAQPAPALAALRAEIMALLDVARPRELPNGRAAPGNVGKGGGRRGR